MEEGGVDGWMGQKKHMTFTQERRCGPKDATYVTDVSDTHSLLTLGNRQVQHLHSHSYLHVFEPWEEAGAQEAHTGMHSPHRKVVAG